MNEASAPVSHLLMFAGLCVVLGPAIGTLTEVVLALEAIDPHHGFQPLGPIFDFRFAGPVLFFGYIVGAPIAFIAAVLFGIAVRRYDWHGLGAANLAAIVAAALVILSVAVLSPGRGNQVDLSSHAISNLLAIVISGMVAITVCWCIARVIGILR